MNFQDAVLQYNQLLQERYDFVHEWRQLSDYLLPSRGLLHTYNRPQKRKLSPAKVINPTGSDALGVLVAELHSRLTSPSRPWFKLEWDNPEARQDEFLDWWLQDAQERMFAELAQSNFYSSILSFYEEWTGFGTGSMFVGENEGNTVFQFDTLSIGEYVISVNYQGVVDTLFRTIIKSPRAVVDEFGKNSLSDSVKRQAEKTNPARDNLNVILLEAITPEKFEDKSFTQRIFEYTISGNTGSLSVAQQPALKERKALRTRGFYEFPYPTCRWSTLGGDVYGVGRGSRALPDIKRLQEIDAAFLMAIHKEVEPPVNAPYLMKNQLNTLPGGMNWFNNPNQKITKLYDMQFDYQGAAAAGERIEGRIKKAFYNDIFLSTSRDPNATPFKAAEVAAKEREKMTRLGPVVERAQHEFFLPLINRCFNIMLRRGKFAQVPEQYANAVSGLEVTMISPLAQAQKLVALESIENFIVYAGQLAQYDQEVLDRVDSDHILQEIADISGTSSKVLRSDKEVDQIRQQRAAQQKQQQELQQQMMVQQFQAEMAKKQADVGKTRADIAETVRGLNG